MDEDHLRWGIWIDVEGFGNLWSASSLALRGLNHLMGMIFEVGSRCYPDDPNRLFAHQIGDGFYIASDFHETSLDRCAALAIHLMRGMTSVGCVARASIAEGALADYGGCRPRAIQAELARTSESDAVGLGSGLMTLQAVMGQGIINAVAIDKTARTSGALLMIEALKRDRLSDGFVVRTLEKNEEIAAIDWIHSTTPILDEIEAMLGAPPVTVGDLEHRLTDYIAHHGLPPTWSEPTLRHVGLM